MIQLSDRYSIELDDATKVRRTADGYLIASPRVARTGIQLYRGSEVGKPDMAVVKVMRPESEVFKDSAMASLAYKPVTDNHPNVQLDARSWTKHARGIVGAEVIRDGEFIRVPLMVSDEQLIQKIQSGKAQLSVGYTCDLKWQPGEYNGEKYDAIQTEIKANHIAVVDAARGGPELKIGDSNMENPILHRPGALAMADTASQEQAREQRLQRLGDAWKSPPSSAQTDNQSATAPAATSDDAYARRDQRLRDAWRASA
jgi:hypothetical protein